MRAVAVGGGERGEDQRTLHTPPSVLQGYRRRADRLLATSPERAAAGRHEAVIGACNSCAKSLDTASQAARGDSRGSSFLAFLADGK